MRMIGRRSEPVKALGENTLGNNVLVASSTRQARLRNGESASVAANGKMECFGLKRNFVIGGKREKGTGKI